MVPIQDLKRCEIFDGLTEAELEYISEMAKVTEYEAGKRIFEEKSIAKNLYLILEGKVEIRMSRDEGGEQLPIETLRPGEIFGWSAVTEPYTFTAAAWTLDRSKFFVFDGEILRDLFKKNNHIGYKIMRKIAAVISSRLRHLNQKLVNML